MNFPNTWEDYTSQYLEMAENLIKHNPINNDLIIPTMYIARHYIELRTKMIAKIAKVMNGGEPKKVTGHNLKTLWDESSHLIVQTLKNHGLYSPHVQVQLQQIQNFINKRTNWDDDSMALRYPYDLHGSAYELKEDISLFKNEWNNCTEALEYIYKQLTTDIQKGTIPLTQNQKDSLRNNGIII
ncbi:hypothetical protein IEK_01259 [Bacillus toyonensis]|uniref:HEPN domain-containing protein n=1 Tax=Bacillus luti TaxID=2026191 RepID=A0A7V7SAG2_9BACI|nr:MULTISPECIES: hypothetical protein [Bacillus cereus group]EJV52610.1 hypothetical protein IEK_01259 [Bacillus toyonensis]KAB2444730.1 hypothetical protein F8163_05985 [Bacillus luti]